jgi:hypothetical protein
VDLDIAFLMTACASFNHTLPKIGVSMVPGLMALTVHLGGVKPSPSGEGFS